MSLGFMFYLVSDRVRVSSSLALGMHLGALGMDPGALGVDLGIQGEAWRHLGVDTFGSGS